MFISNQYFNIFNNKTLKIVKQIRKHERYANHQSKTILYFILLIEQFERQLVKKVEEKNHFPCDFATCLFVVAALNHLLHNIAIKKVDDCMRIISPFKVKMDIKKFVKSHILNL